MSHHVWLAGQRPTLNVCKAGYIPAYTNVKCTHILLYVLHGRQTGLLAKNVHICTIIIYIYICFVFRCFLFVFCSVYASLIKHCMDLDNFNVTVQHSYLAKLRDGRQACNCPCQCNKLFFKDRSSTIERLQIQAEAHNARRTAKQIWDSI